MAGALSPPGTSVYSSNTLHVGDGTWDASRDDFLLPNIQGLNFQTMRYNGMGNRFRSLSEYHSLIIGHGVIAAVTFLGLIPSAILIAGFYHTRPALALRLHISLQVLTVLMATVVLMLGYFAVGPQRSLTNPHHGIGIAIYVSVLVQSLGGWLIHRIEKGKIRYNIPIKLMLHQWLGRATALLALAQVPIGLTLYGSPLVLFILYAVYMTGLLISYFLLVYRANQRVASGVDERGSYLSGSQSDFSDNSATDHHHNSLKTLGATAAGAAGLAALTRRRLLQNHQRSESGANMLDSELGFNGEHGSYPGEKNLPTPRREQNCWTEKLLDGATSVGTAVGLRRFFYPKKRPNKGGDVEVSQRPEADTPNGSALYVDRMEAGLPLPGSNFTAGPTSEYSNTLRAPFQIMTNSPTSNDIHGIPDSQRAGRKGRLGHRLARYTTFGSFRNYVKRRRERRTQLQNASEMRTKQFNDSPLTWAKADTQSHLENSSNLNGATPNIATLNGRRTHINASVVSPQPHSMAHSHSSYQNFIDRAPSGTGGFPTTTPTPPSGGLAYHSRPPELGPLNGNQSRTTGIVPPAPPAHQELLLSTPSGSYKSPDRRVRTYGTPTRTQITESPQSRANGSRMALSSSQGNPQPTPIASLRNFHDRTDDLRRSLDSPPVSVKVKMHSDGRHVTLRRLDEAEAAAERESYMPSGRGVLTHDFSNIQHFNGPDTSAQGATSQVAAEPLPQKHTSPNSSATGPQAIDSSSLMAPGQHNSGPDVGSYESNRRRRRAERARAQAKQTSHGENISRVDFT